MASSIQLYVDGKAADPAIAAGFAVLEVEENADMPGAIQITVPVDRTEGGELSFVADPAFKPLVNLSVTAVAGTALPECIFDGVVLSHKLHLERGIVNSRLRVWGQDYSWMMNLEEKVKEWVGVTDSIVASTILQSYGVVAGPDNSKEDSPSHTEQGHSLMQRGTDAQFLRDLARRNGKLFRVACANDPAVKVGHFAAPNLDGAPVATLLLNDPEKWSIAGLDIDWDVSRPTSVVAGQKLVSDSSPSGFSTTATSTGLTALAERDLTTFAAKPMSVMLTSVVDDGGELTMRAKAALREAGWFVRCEAEADIGKIGVVPRVGQIFQLDGLGSLHSGKYYAWSVRHTITADSHKARIVFVRNAIGPEPAASGGLGGLL